MKATFNQQRAAVAFLIFATATYLGNYAIVRWNLAVTNQPTPEWPVAVDFLLMLPLAYILIFRPAAKKALLVFVGLASIGILFGSLIIPEDDKWVWKYLEQGRWFFLAMLLTLQILVMAAAAAEIYRNRHAQNIEAAIEQALAKRVPPGQVLALLQADARVWTYALLRDPRRFQVPADAFFCAKHDSNASNQQAFLWLIAFEIPLAHAVIHLFSPVWAVIVSATSLYGFLFLLAEYRATIFRATTLGDRAVHIRHGVLGDLVVPYDQISTVTPETRRPRRARRALRFVGTGTANIKLALKPGSRLDTIVGTREVDTVYLGLDEAHRFMRELHRRIGT